MLNIPLCKTLKCEERSVIVFSAVAYCTVLNLSLYKTLKCEEWSVINCVFTLGEAENPNQPEQKLKCH